MKSRCAITASLFVACAFVVAASAQPRAAQPAAAQKERTRYRIDLKLDFDARTFTGTERVRWVNRDARPASVLYFHLYANVRGGATETPRPGAAPEVVDDQATPDEPRVEIASVRAAAAGSPLQFALDERATLLRVSLREPVAANASVEIEIEFRGRVPEIDPDETSLPSHVIQQLGAAMRETRESRRARDTNFVSRGVMLLGSCYPLLAARDGNEWQREARATIGDWLHADAADYEVTVETAPDVAVFTSARERTTNAGQGEKVGGAAAAVEKVEITADRSVKVEAATDRAAGGRAFAGESLRSFAVVAGRSLQSAEQAVGGVRVRAVWAREHEKTGRRVLDVAARALKVFAARFGALPVDTVTVAEVPLVAGVGSAEFAGMTVIASAFYVDFDSATVRNLPELVREQRSSVEDSLEFAVAHMVAHQWWGASVGSDPEREPVLDESLAHWSALLYYREAYGAERATAASDDQLRGVYEIYRTFGGEDLPADRAARDYRNSFQYAAIVDSKGALMFVALEKLMGAERVFTALRRYHEANRLEIAEANDLVGAFIAEAPVAERRGVARTFDRWLSERHGDEDIAPPNPQLAAAFGMSVEQATGDGGNRFSRLGKFFWRQMTRIR
ncbi:MAG: hypothetical protein LC785_05600 [Acidobacteria bacterium]|nr:hypothetical protein [Acidobacteriota bacterium]MCA1641426.1 hypothetical protein [Acidobacteriota bacterium]